MMLSGSRAVPLLAGVCALAVYLAPSSSGPAPIAPFDGRGVEQRAGLDTLRGSDGSDVIKGTEGDDVLDGRAGDDHLSGLGGDDVLWGGADRDLLDGGNGSDVLEAGEGDDQLYGGDGRDWLFGDDGADVLRGGAGNDVIEGGAGPDQVDGGDGDDILDGSEGDDVLTGGAGNDAMDGGDGVDNLDGGPGNDNLDGEDENDVLLGREGVDTLMGSDGGDYLDGGPDDDLIDGGDENDILIGGPGNDMLVAGDGNDQASGGAGNDVLAGGDGDDVLNGDAGDDLLSGGAGDDLLRGAAGTDTLFGFEGGDDLRGGPGDDLLRGGAGDDRLTGDAGADRLLPGIGTDHTAAGDGNDLIMLRAGDVDSEGLETIEGGTNSDTAMVEADTLVLNGFIPRHFSSSHALALERRLVLSDPSTGGVYAIADVEQILYWHYFAHIAGDARRPASVVLVNPSRREANHGRMDFAAADGAPLAVSVNRTAAQPSFEFQIPPLGSVELELRAGGDVFAGSIRMQADRPVGGMTQGAVPDVGRIWLGESPLLDAFALPVEMNKEEGITTGIAVRNGAAPGTLKLTLRTAEAVEVEATEIDVPANGQLVQFLHQAFPRFEEFQGTVTVEGGPIAASGIRVGPDGFTAAPVMPALMPVGPRVQQGAVHFAHLVAGGGRRSSITLVNPTFPDTARGELLFFDEAGNELQLELENREPAARVAFELAPGRMAVFTTRADGASVMASARAQVTTGRVGAEVRYTLPAVGIVAAAPNRPLSAFIAPVRANRGERVTTLVAVSSTGAGSTLECSLRLPDGTEVRGGRASLTLPANGHVARGLDELFPGVDLRDFRGTVTVNGDGAAITAIVMQLGAAEGSGVVLPVLEVY